MLTDVRHRHNMEMSGGWIYAIVKSETPLVRSAYESRPKPEHRLLAYALQTAVTLVGVVAIRRDVRKIEQHLHTLLAAQRIRGNGFIRI